MIRPDPLPPRPPLCLHEQRLCLNEGTLCYWDSGGEGPPLLLLHGLFDHKGTWSPLFERLGGAARLLAPDLLGSGASDKPRLPPDGYAYSPAMHCDHLKHLIEALDLRHIVLGGASLGGGIALYLLRRHPDLLRRISGLVLIAPAAYPQAPPGYIGRLGSPLGRLLAGRAAQKAVVSLGLGRRAVERTYRRVFFDAGKIPPAQIKTAVALLGSPGIFYAYHLSARHIAPPDGAALAASYANLDLPALVLWGAQDRILPPVLGRRLAADLPRSSLRLFERCGHAPHLEQTDPVAEEIRGWTAQTL